MRRARCSVKPSENYRDSVMHRVMMLRFRPIAPKPVGGDQAVSSAVKIIGTRKKRKYVRVRGRRNTNQRSSKIGRPSPPEKSGVEDDLSADKGAETETLQLMVERSESDKSCGNSTVQKIHEKNWNITGDEVNLKVNSVAAAPGSVRSVIKTWIIVECVTDAFTDSGVGLGHSDWDKINSLRVDTCPGFISDGTQNVVWINDAYRKMVAAPEEAENGIMVWLAVKEELPNYSPAFACRVRMSQQTKEGYKWNRILACDVWRFMESAGFAWKLDVNTALGLSI